MTHESIDYSPTAGHVIHGQGMLYDWKGGNAIALVYDGSKYGHRLSECWNACAGIADPGKAIAAARHAITEASAELLAELENDPEASLMRGALEALNAAAVLFGMEPEALPPDPDAEDEE